MNYLDPRKYKLKQSGNQKSEIKYSNYADYIICTGKCCVTFEKNAK